MSNYFSDDYKNLKFKFKNSEMIEKNFSQAYQDIFVLSMLNGKQKGTYLEIGANDPFNINNTALLELNFQWTGISIDIEHSLVELFNKKRNNKALCADATNINYDHLINIYYNFEGMDKKTIDYLQVDCEPPAITFSILKKVFESSVEFKVITFEHDAYSSGDEFKILSRKFLNEKGYMLIGSNICNGSYYDEFEDWWVNPNYVDKDIVNKFLANGPDKKLARDFVLNS